MLVAIAKFRHNSTDYVENLYHCRIIYTVYWITCRNVQTSISIVSSVYVQLVSDHGRECKCLYCFVNGLFQDPTTAKYLREISMDPSTIDKFRSKPQVKYMIDKIEECRKELLKRGIEPSQPSQVPHYLSRMQFNVRNQQTTLGLSQQATLQFGFV